MRKSKILSKLLIISILVTQIVASSKVYAEVDTMSTEEESTPLEFSDASVTSYLIIGIGVGSIIVTINKTNKYY